MMPSMPSSMSPVFQPAMAMYSKPCPASVAENFVFAPISRAFSRRASKSDPVAPDMADTLDIWESKSAVVFTAAAPMPTMGAVTVLVRVDPTEDIFPPTDSSVLPTESILFKVSFALAASLARFFSSCSVATISRWSASYLSLPRSPDSICCFACSCACFRASSFSFVAPILSLRRACFCERSSVCVGSSFRRRSTSFNWLWVSFMVLLTDSRLLLSPVVDPLISTVMPAIRLAIFASFPMKIQIKKLAIIHSMGYTVVTVTTVVTLTTFRR